MKKFRLDWPWDKYYAARRGTIVAMNEIMKQLSLDNNANIEEHVNGIQDTCGEYCIVHSLIYDFDFWYSLVERKVFPLWMVARLLNNSVVYILQRDHNYALALGCKLIKQACTNNNQTSYTYANSILHHILQYTKCCYTDTDPTLYLELLAELVRIDNAEQQVATEKAIMPLLNIIIEDLAAIGHFDIDLNTIIENRAKDNGLFIVLRRHKRFYPVLVRYLHSLRETNPKLLQQLYPLAIRHCLVDQGGPFDYSGLCEMFPEVVAGGNSEGDLEHVYVNFLLKVNYVDKSSMNAIISKLDQYHSPEIVTKLIKACLFNNIDGFRKIISKIFNSEALKQNNEQHIIDSILDAFLLLGRDIIPQLLCLAKEILRHKEACRTLLYNKMYSFDKSQYVVPVVLLFIVALLDGEEAWPSFVQKHISQDAFSCMEPETLEKFIVLVFVVLLRHYLELRLSCSDIVARGKAAISSLAQIGLAKHIITKKLKEATKEFKETCFGTERFLVSDYIARILQEELKQKKKAPQCRAH